MSPSDADDERSAETDPGTDVPQGADQAPGQGPGRVPDHDPSPVPGPGGDDGQDAASREAAAWQAIVDNYGDHPSFDDPGPAEAPPAPRPTTRRGPDRMDLDDGPSGALADAGSRPDDEVRDDPEDHFVPPPPPRVALATPPRLLAWLGLFGVPLLTLVAIVAGVSFPQWLSVLFMAWFVGGFVFLVASMRSGPRDGHDDGAVL